MFGERRKHQRFSMERVARIQADVGATAASFECTIIDISDRGARLFVNDDQVPDRFDLIVFGDRPVRQDCRVAWRLGGELGVEFLSVQFDPSRINAMERLRNEARNIFQAKSQAN